MFVKVVPNNKGRKGTSFIYLTESYREDGKVKHRTIRELGVTAKSKCPESDLIICPETAHLGDFE